MTADRPFDVLLVGHREHLPADVVPGDDQRYAPDLRAAVTSTAHEALALLERKGFDAVVCWAEQDNELSIVIRIRKASPNVPIVVLTSKDDAGFEKRARQAGATRTATPVRDAEALSGFLRELLRSGELHAELRRQVRWVRSQAGALRRLARQNRTLSGEIREAQRRPSPRRFEPLLVEDDATQAFLMLRAFEKADVSPRHPVLRTGEDAIAYLSARRDAGDLPTVLLLDVELPGMSGLDVLAWMKGQPGFSQVPVVMLSGSTDPLHVNRAYELGAWLFLTKPTVMDALIRLVRILKLQGDPPADPPRPL